MKTIDSKTLLKEVIAIIIALGYDPHVTENGKMFIIRFHVNNGFDSFSVRYKNSISMLLGGFLSEFYYDDDCQDICILKECNGINPNSDKYGCLLHEMRLVNDDNNKEIFINRIDHFDRITF